MRKLVRWTIVTLGIAALVRWFRRRGEEPATEAVDAYGDPAEELRRKLAESRGEADIALQTPAVTVEERRAEVHEQARAALSEMAPDEAG